MVRKSLRRSQMLPFFAKLPPCLVGIEACGKSDITPRRAQCGNSPMWIVVNSKRCLRQCPLR